MTKIKSTTKGFFSPPLEWQGGGFEWAGRGFYRYIEISQSGSIVRINLNRPERHNALVPELLTELDQALDEVAERKELLFMVLSGKGRSFCAGADLNWFSGSEERSPEQNGAQYKQLADILLKLFQMPLITIAVVCGNVFGGGIGLMAVCDFVLADSNTRFMFSEVKLGLLPAIVLPFVAKRLSIQDQRKWILTGNQFFATNAHQAGLVDVLCEDGLMESTLLEFIATFGSAAPSAVKKAKSMINQVTSGILGTTDTALTANILAEALLSIDGQEGIRAFFEKRKPEWQ